MYIFDSLFLRRLFCWFRRHARAFWGRMKSGSLSGLLGETARVVGSPQSAAAPPHCTPPRRRHAQAREHDATVRPWRRMSRGIRLLGAAACESGRCFERDTDHARELGLAIGFGEQKNARIEPALVHDG